MIDCTIVKRESKDKSIPEIAQLLYNGATLKREDISSHNYDADSNRYYDEIVGVIETVKGNETTTITLHSYEMIELINYLVKK